jgi:hypothetical protein
VSSPHPGCSTTAWLTLQELSCPVVELLGPQGKGLFVARAQASTLHVNLLDDIARQ